MQKKNIINNEKTSGVCPIDDTQFRANQNYGKMKTGFRLFRGFHLTSKQHVDVTGINLPDKVPDEFHFDVEKGDYDSTARTCHSPDNGITFPDAYLLLVEPLKHPGERIIKGLSAMRVKFLRETLQVTFTADVEYSKKAYLKRFLTLDGFQFYWNRCCYVKALHKVNSFIGGKPSVFHDNWSRQYKYDLYEQVWSGKRDMAWLQAEYFKFTGIFQVVEFLENSMNRCNRSATPEESLVKTEIDRKENVYYTLAGVCTESNKTYGVRLTKDGWCVVTYVIYRGTATLLEQSEPLNKDICVAKYQGMIAREIV